MLCENYVSPPDRTFFGDLNAAVFPKSIELRDHLNKIIGAAGKHSQMKSRAFFGTVEVSLSVLDYHMVTVSMRKDRYLLRAPSPKFSPWLDSQQKPVSVAAAESDAGLLKALSQARATAELTLNELGIPVYQ